MKKLLAILALAVLPNLAQAATVVTTWTNPTTNTDTTSIPATGEGSLTSARIEYGTCVGSAFGTKAGEVTRTMPATSATLNLPVGTTCIRVKVTNTYGQESAASNVATKVIAAPIPNPPVLAAVETTAYIVVPNLKTFTFERGRVVGAVQIGATCDAARQTADGYNAISPRSQVKPAAPTGSVIVAKCALK